MPVFAFENGACQPRVYGGCEGNGNRFRTLEECLLTCEGSPVPNGCPADRRMHRICLACGVVGGCGQEIEACAKTCSSNDECDPRLGFCLDGVCQVGGCI